MGPQYEDVAPSLTPTGRAAEGHYGLASDFIGGFVASI